MFEAVTAVLDETLMEKQPSCTETLSCKNQSTADANILCRTNDTSFVNEPTPVPASIKEATPTPLKTPARRVPATRGGGTRGGRARGIPRGRGVSYR